MNQESTVIASGNLASPRRIIAGVLGQFGFLAIPDRTARSILINAGLPARALQEPDFPLSLRQELEICADLVSRIPAGVSPVRLLFEARRAMGIENLGVIGMAMKHAANAVESLKVCLAYPELTMGHCRMVVRQQQDLSLFSFHMDRPVVRAADEGLVDRLLEYCVVLDLSTSLRNIEDVSLSGEPPYWVSLPYPEPDDWHQVAGTLDFPVRFSAEEACIAYPQTFDDKPLPNANPLLFRMSASLAEKMSQMSERNLTRQLTKAGTSYSELLVRVQSERARNFLRNRALSVADIGYRLGYSEPAAFTRAFTQWTGQSPLKWRQAQGGQN